MPLHLVRLGALRAQIDKRSYLMTDDASVYVPIGRDFSVTATPNASSDRLCNFDSVLGTPAAGGGDAFGTAADTGVR